MGNISTSNNKYNENNVDDVIPFNYDSHVKYFLAVFEKLKKY